ncbi:MAG: glutathione peroxidase [Prevotella sp.]|nr:glutathione peroxidase [Prevotella sp.]
MKKNLLVLMLAMISLACSAQKNVYSFEVRDDVGQQVSLSQYKGKVLLIVNTATRCGFTPQYEELENIYQKYNQQGFEILDFPCNQFGEQAPGSIEEIHEFCMVNFDIHFPQFDKIDVNGENASPLFTYLKSKMPFKGFDQSDEMGRLLHEMFMKQDADYAKSPDIKWNFTKFLVDRKGKVIARFEPSDSMQKVEEAIKKLLK